MGIELGSLGARTHQLAANSGGGGRSVWLQTPWTDGGATVIDLQGFSITGWKSKEIMEIRQVKVVN